MQPKLIVFAALAVAGVVAAVLLMPNEPSPDVAPAAPEGTFEAHEAPPAANGGQARDTPEAPAPTPAAAPDPQPNAGAPANAERGPIDPGSRLPSAARAAPPSAGPGEGTGDGHLGPRVGVHPSARDTEARLLNPIPIPDTPSGGPDDPYGEGDHPAMITRHQEEQFLEDVQTAYDRAVTSLADCVQGLAETTSDTVFVEMTVGDNEEDPERGAARIDNFQSVALTGDREVCARRNIAERTLPPPHVAASAEGPGFTVESESDIEYTLRFEIEVGEPAE